ncbi:MAG TPA: hypothetical protein VHF22_12620 [Planctomycetota bacterium]|nr:hypothetical protein [Planctomycetota bacterium]
MHPPGASAAFAEVFRTSNDPALRSMILGNMGSTGDVENTFALSAEVCGLASGTAFDPAMAPVALQSLKNLPYASPESRARTVALIVDVCLKPAASLEFLDRATRVLFEHDPGAIDGLIASLEASDPRKSQQVRSLRASLEQASSRAPDLR